MLKEGTAGRTANNCTGRAFVAKVEKSAIADRTESWGTGDRGGNVTHQRSALAAATGVAAAIKTKAEIIASPIRTPARPIGTPLAQFGAHTASFTSQALGAEWSCFYFLDAECEPFGFQVHRTPWALRESYLTHDMARSDPLHPVSLVTQNLRFVSMFDPRLRCAVELRRHFWNFLSAFGARDAAEMIFRVGGRAVAGMSLLWVGQAGSRADRQLGESVQSYIEFNLAPYIREVHATGPCAARNPLDLTGRQLEIAQLICDGLTNIEIARRLNIGTATVKTHLLHVFEKVGVQTRATLATRFLSATHRLNA